MMRTKISTRLFLIISAIIGIASVTAGYYYAFGRQSDPTKDADRSPATRNPTRREGDPGDDNDDASPESATSSASQHIRPLQDAQSCNQHGPRIGNDGHDGGLAGEDDDGQRVSDDELDDDPFKPFHDVMEVLNLEALVKIAVKQRRLTEACSQELYCNIELQPKCGSFNLVYFLKFSDGIRWIARIPGDGHELWDVDKQRMDSIYWTMRYIKSKTSLQMPTVHYWSTGTEEIGSAFALLSCIEGSAVSDLWFDKKWVTQSKRLKILNNIATSMIQLYYLQFEKIGMLQFDSVGQPVAVGPDIGYATDLESKCAWEKPVICGPHDDMRSWLTRSIETIELDGTGSGSDELRPVQRIMLQTIPNYMSSVPLALAHADFNFQNIFVDPETCAVTGIIDWDDVGVQPVSAGCGRYPSWITRDWDPAMYNGHWRDPMKDEQESLPKCLSKYRKYYAACWKRLLEQEVTYDPRWTRYSHILEAIKLCRNNDVSSSYIFLVLLHHSFRGELDFTYRDFALAWNERDADTFLARIKDMFSNMWYAEWEHAPGDDEESAIKPWYAEFYTEDLGDIGMEKYLDMDIAPDISILDEI